MPDNNLTAEDIDNLSEAELDALLIGDSMPIEETDYRGGLLGGPEASIGPGPSMADKINQASAQVLAGGTEIAGASLGGMAGFATPIPGGAAIGAALGDEAARQFITEPLGLRPQTDILSTDTGKRVATNAGINLLFGAITKHLFGGGKVLYQYRDAENPLPARITVGDSVTDRAIREEAQRAEKTLIDSGLLEGGNTFNPKTLRFDAKKRVDPISGELMPPRTTSSKSTIGQLTPIDVKNTIRENMPILKAERNSAIVGVDQIAQTARESGKKGFENIGIISGKDVLPHIDELAQQISKLKKTTATQGHADNAEKVMQDLIDDLYPKTTILDANGNPLRRVEKFTISQITEQIDNTQLAMRTLGAFDDRLARAGVTEEAAKARVDEVAGKMRLTVNALKEARRQAIKQVEKADPDAFKSAGLTSDRVDTLNEKMHHLLDLEKAFGLADERIRQKATAGIASGKELSGANPRGFVRVKGVSIGETLRLSDPKRVIHDNQVKVMKDLVEIAKIRRAGRAPGLVGRIPGAAGMIAPIVDKNPGAAIALGGEAIAAGQRALSTGSPFEALAPDFASKMATATLPDFPKADVISDAEKVFASQSGVVGTLGLVKQRFMAEKLSELEESGELDQILAVPEGEEILNQYLTDATFQTFEAVDDLLVQAHKKGSPLEQQAALSEVVAQFPEYFPAPISGVKGEIKVGNKNYLPRVRDRALYSANIAENPALDDAQKARMRSAVHRDGEVIKKPSKFVPTHTRKTTNPAIAADE